MNFDISSLARLDLRQIWIFSPEEWGRRRADTYLDEIRATIIAVARDHSRGTLVGEPGADYRKAIVGSHAIFYRVVDEKVWIIRVLHQAMDAGSHLN